MKRFRQAISFLTTIPVPYPLDIPITEIGKAAGWFPLVGLILGGLLTSADFLLRLVFPPLPAAVLLIIVWVLLTGGLHLDGLADCGDGLFVSGSRDKRLEILKDPRVGSFGVLSLLLQLILKIALLTTLPASLRWAAFFSAPAVGRSLLVITALQPNARPGGLGDMFKSSLPPLMKVVPWLILFPLLPLLFTGWILLPAVLFPICATVIIIITTRKLLGGITGDVLGLVTEISESAVLLAFSIKFFS